MSDQSSENPLIAGNYPWWLKNSLFSIPGLWAMTTERDVKVAILDTGISKHVDFDFSKTKGYNYLSDSVDYQTDVNGHGTHCAGIIAAKGLKSYGVAPGSLLFVAKVCDDNGRPAMAAVQRALNDIYNGKNGADEVRIINMSFNVPARNPQEVIIKKEIATLIGKLSQEKQCIIVCSSGSVDDIDDSFPAKVEDCIAVGSLSSQLVRSTFSRITAILDIMAPGEGIVSSAGTGSTISKDGTSQAAAFVSGVCALAFQKMHPAEITQSIFKKTLFQTAISNSFSLPEYGHGIIDPNRLIETLNQIS